MAKEWVLNSATNRFQLNFKRNVGPTSESIRRCQPNSLSEWESFYYENVKPREHLIDLGRKLYVKITEVLVSEIDQITEQDCIDYIVNLVINRTYDGYVTEIKTVYGQLEQLLGIEIESAPDEWDRLYNVDFYSTINGKHIGYQIKPVADVSQIPQIFKERNLQKQTHTKFEREFGGKVFYVFSITENKQKRIQNPEVVTEIKAEIERLKEL